MFFYQDRTIDVGIYFINIIFVKQVYLQMMSNTIYNSTMLYMVVVNFNIFVLLNS